MAPTRGQNRTNPPPRRGPCRSPQLPFTLLSTTTRSDYSRHGCTIFGWPSTGGVIIRPNCDIVELRFLGWEPFEVPESRPFSQNEEDTFCTKLKMIGGRWWPNRKRFLDVTEESWKVEGTEDRELYIGWPEGGGVLIVDNKDDEIPWDIGKLRLVTTMEERCELMKDKLERDAEYYKDPWSYPGFIELGLEKSEK